MRRPKIDLALEGVEAVGGTDANHNARDGNAVGVNTTQIESPLMTSALLNIRERRNWLIHQLYVRQEYSDCLRVVETQLQECRGVCEYALYVKGLLMRRNGELTNSLNFFQTAMLINPQNTAIWRQVAQALLLLGKHRAAIEAFRESERLSKNQATEEDWVVHYGIATCYMYLKDYESAEVEFVKSISIQRQDCCIMQLGKVLVMKKDYARAIHLYEEALRTSPNSPDILTTLGLLQIKVGRHAEAFHHLGRCLTLNSSNPTAIMAAASIMQENRDFGGALNKYRVAVAKLPHSAHLWSNIGMCFFAQKNMHAAVACLRKAVALAPFEWRIMYNMGLVFLHLKQYASAFHYLFASTRLNSNYAPAFMHLAVSLALMNDVENSCAAYTRALSIEEDPLVLLNYAVTLVNCRQHARAREEYEKFLRLWQRTDERRQRELGPSVPRTMRLLAERLRGGGAEAAA